VVIRSNVGERTNLHFHVRDLSKSCLLDLDEKEVENVNKSGQRIIKHAKLSRINEFDE
jgi:hypothetical protein